LASPLVARQTMLRWRSLWLGPPDGGVSEEAPGTLCRLACQAKDQRDRGAGILVPGQGCVEIIREVQHEGHDLVVVGTHTRAGSNVSCSAVRRAPCFTNARVRWVSKPGPEIIPQNILVATDLSPLRTRLSASDLPSGTAAAHTHVLDVIEYPLDRLWSPVVGDQRFPEVPLRVRGEPNKRCSRKSSTAKALSQKPGYHHGPRRRHTRHAIVKFINDHRLSTCSSWEPSPGMASLGFVPAYRGKAASGGSLRRLAIKRQIRQEVKRRPKRRPKPTATSVDPLLETHHAAIPSAPDLLNNSKTARAQRHAASPVGPLQLRPV